MSKELEALERLYIAGDLRLRYVTEGKQKEDFNIIEKALKDYYQLQDDYDNLRDGYYALSFQHDRLKYQKEKQGNALKTISDIIRDFNKGEFASAEIALQEITNILSEVVL